MEIRSLNLEFACLPSKLSARHPFFNISPSDTPTRKRLRKVSICDTQEATQTGLEDTETFLPVGNTIHGVQNTLPMVAWVCILPQKCNTNMECGTLLWVGSVIADSRLMCAAFSQNTNTSHWAWADFSYYCATSCRVIDE